MGHLNPRIIQVLLFTPEMYHELIQMGESNQMTFMQNPIDHQF